MVYPLPATREARGRLRFKRRFDPIAKLTVRVQPGARRERIIGFTDGILRLSVQAAPVEGAANRALVRFLARVFETAPSRIRLVRGHKSRTKTVDLADVSPGALEEEIERIITTSGRAKGN